MKQLYSRIIISILAFSFVEIHGQDLEDACIQCHVDIDDDLENPIMTNIFDDVHLQKGFSCSDCHGGDPTAFDDMEASMWDSDSFVGQIDKAKEIEICGKCHSDLDFMRQYAVSATTDQASQYWTSQHGMELAKGDLKVAVCSSCHGIHGIYPVKDPRSKVYPLNIPSTCALCHSNSEYMAEYDIDTDQYDNYALSVHGTALLERQDIGAPACNDCHGNHGAIPPNLNNISDVCGACHVNNMDLFKGSNLYQEFINLELKQCESCHGEHLIEKPTDELLNLSTHPNCETSCHSIKSNSSIKMSTHFYQLIDSLKFKLNFAEERISLAETKGMEVSDLFIHIEEANKVLIQSRTGIHSFNSDIVSEITNTGFKELSMAIEGAQDALDEHSYRRKGLFIFSILITIFVIVFYIRIKIRD